MFQRRVSPEDVQLCEEKYNKSKMVHSILRHVAESTASYKLENLYKVNVFQHILMIVTRNTSTWVGHSTGCMDTHSKLSDSW